MAGVAAKWADAFEFLAGGGVPDAGGLVITGGDDEFAVRAVGG